MPQKLANVEALVERLEAHVVPNEVGVYPHEKAADFREVINAGWIYKLSILSQVSHRGSTGPSAAVGEVDFSRELELVNRLVLKAVEACAIKGTFREAEDWGR